MLPSAIEGARKEWGDDPTNRIVEHRAMLALARLQAGEYLLTFEARTGSQIEYGRVRFTVEESRPQ